MTGTIHLIVEDATDVDVVRAILRAKQIKVEINPLRPSGGMGGITRLAKELEQLIETARRSRKNRDCIAVLHDDDVHVQPDRAHYDTIKAICDRHADVVEVIARDAIEAWLLADAGICKWLGEKARNRDSDSKPKNALKSLVKKKTGRDYTGANRATVLGHLSGDTKSKSLEQALKHLDNAPCVRDS